MNMHLSYHVTIPGTDTVLVPHGTEVTQRLIDWLAQDVGISGISVRIEINGNEYDADMIIEKPTEQYEAPIFAEGFDPREFAPSVLRKLDKADGVRIFNMLDEAGVAYELYDRYGHVIGEGTANNKETLFYILHQLSADID